MTARTQRADAQANRKALLRAAVAVISEQGGDVAMEDIASAAGVSRATLYRHFPNRTDLLSAILDGLLDHLDETAAGLPDGPERFRELFRACVDMQSRTLPFIDFVTAGTPEETLLRIRGRFRELFDGPLRQAQAAGIARPEIEANDVRLVLTMMSAVARQNVEDADRTRALELAERVLLLQT